MNKNIYRHVIFILFFITFYPLLSFSQTAPPFEWAKNCQSYYSGTSGTGSYGTAICTDDNANIYTTGWLTANGTIYLDTCTLSSVGSANYFIVSHDSSGNLRWVNQFKGKSVNIANDIVYDDAGHIYATGAFSDSISFDGITYFLASQLNCYYIARFDTAGNFQWAKIFNPNAASGWISNIHLSVDNGHNLYATGRYTNSLSVDTSIMNIPSTDNFYFAKFDSSGTIQYIKSGYAKNIYNLQISQDSQSNTYITGGPMSDTVSIQSLTLTGKGTFIAGFNANGDLKWMNLAIGNAATGAKIQIVDNLLYVAGFYNDSLHIGTTTFYTPTLIHNTFLAQFDTAGSFYWAKRIDVGSGTQIRVNSMVASGYYIYVAGEFTKTITFNGIQYTSVTPLGARDPFVAAYDYNGNELWFKSVGSFHEDYGYDIDIDNEHNLYITGSTHYPSTFDSIVLTDTIAGPAGNPFGIFIAKIDNNNVLSTPGISSSTQVLIFPNPLTTQSKITFYNPENQKFVFTITNITGQVVEAGSTENSEIILTKGSKSAGIYLFNLINEKTGERMNGKVVVSE